MKTLIRIVFCLCLSVIVSLGLIPAAQAQCSVNGTYIYSYTGLIGTNNGLTNMNSFRPTATAGQITFTNSTLSGSQTDNSTGTVFAISYSGTYTLDTTTCSGTLTRTFENGFEVQETFFVTQDGREIRFVRTSPSWFIVAGSLTRQGTP
jgi:hypothetical protein